MGERVVSSEEKTLKALGGATILGVTKDGVAWGKLDDAAFLSGLKGNIPLSLLYFSMEDYEHAMRRLPPEQVERAVLARRVYFSSASTGRATDWFYRGARRVLVSCAIAAEQGPSRSAPVLVAHFGNMLDHLARLSSQGRFDDLDSRTLLLYVAEGEAGLLDEAGKLGTQFGIERVLERLEDFRTQYSTYARMLAELGNPELQVAPPYIQARRGVLFVGAGSELAQSFRAHCMPSVILSKGVIGPMPDRQIYESDQRDRVFLYFTEGEFVEALAGLTDAQIERDVDERREAMERTPAVLVGDYFFGIHLQQAFLRRSLLDALHREALSYWKELEAHVLVEESWLRRVLSEMAPWVGPGEPPSGSGTLTKLQSDVRRLSEDASFLASICTAQGEDFLAVKFVSFAAELEMDWRRIQSL
ncbi:hypothetical protein BE20_00830 [Sorangium cellulosum]|uniref:Uncharacterized protein n=1 Tax=Sorangium cellulosum TaxID=56 RepID=A0A150SP51_SORCE|nr:hypothetical protein BE18_18620 [Sorangium cellulosum]KYF94233.1 hypothetical protein BE20_00830 [Sorangium cellulosum]